MFNHRSAITGTPGMVRWSLIDRQKLRDNLSFPEILLWPTVHGCPLDSVIQKMVLMP